MRSPGGDHSADWAPAASASPGPPKLTCWSHTGPVPVQPVCRPLIQLNNTASSSLASLGRQHKVRPDFSPPGVSACTQDVLCSLSAPAQPRTAVGFPFSSRNSSGKWGDKGLARPSAHWWWLQLPHALGQVQLQCLCCAHSEI